MVKGKGMVKVVIMCDVPKERQAEFLKLSRKGTKPYWEAHGVISYDVWKTDEEGSPGFIKEMYVKDVAAAKKVFRIRATVPEAKDLVDRWEGMTENLNLKIYKLMT
jgi:quinol monooxygenase YgiN